MEGRMTNNQFSQDKKQGQTFPAPDSSSTAWAPKKKKGEIFFLGPIATSVKDEDPVRGISGLRENVLRTKRGGPRTQMMLKQSAMWGLSHKEKDASRKKKKQRKGEDAWWGVILVCAGGEGALERGEARAGRGGKGALKRGKTLVFPFAGGAAPLTNRRIRGKGGSRHGQKASEKGGGRLPSTKQTFAILIADGELKEKVCACLKGKEKKLISLASRRK